ncbi:MAG: cytochrome c [Paracoccaceae bacterium]|nr:cytochrome c [Paracoccaceae bacterium]
MIRTSILVLGGVFLASTTWAQELPEGDPEAGRKVAGMCRTCHGLDGFAKIPIAPHIGGEPVDYLAAQLAAFREGTREHEMMSVVARGLSDQNISDVAAWYSAHQVNAELPTDADESGAPEQCSACHGAVGLSELEDAPHLAGETNIYIETQLKAFRSGKRTHDVMTAIALELSDEDIRAVANWYAAVKLEISAPE